MAILIALTFGAGHFLIGKAYRSNRNARPDTTEGPTRVFEGAEAKDIADIPPPPRCVARYSAETATRGKLMTTYSSDAGPAEVMSFYDKSLGDRGWKLWDKDYEHDPEAPATILSYRSGAQTLFITIAERQNGGSDVTLLRTRTSAPDARN